MKKSDFWKVLTYIEVECDPSTLRWFESMALLYALNIDACDEFISAFSYYDVDEEV